MPIYDIEHPKTGQKIRLEGDGVPTDADIREAFAAIGPPTKAVKTQADFAAEQGDSGKRYPMAKHGQPLASNTEDYVPEWGRKNPNLYGAYGAGRSLVRTGLESLGTSLGATAGAAGGTAIAPGAGTLAGGLAGAGAGYAGGKRLADLVLQEPSDNTLGGIAKDVAIGSVLQGTGNLVTKGATKLIPQSALDKLYNSAMKIPTTTPMTERKAFAATGLKEGAIPKESANAVERWMGMKGHSQIVEKISNFNDEIERIIQSSTNQGGTVSASEVVKRLDDLLAKGKIIDRADPAFTDAILRVKNEFTQKTIVPASMHSPAITQPRPDAIPVDEAQTMKRHIYKVYSDYYGMPDAVGAYIQGKKALARGLKEELETLHPEIKAINMSEGELLKFLDPYNRAIGRIQNRDVVGLGMQTAPIVGAALSGGSPAAAKATTLAKLIDTPSIKARVAILLNKAKKSQRSAVRQAAGRVIPTAAIAYSNQGE